MLVALLVRAVSLQPSQLPVPAGLLWTVELWAPLVRTRAMATRVQSGGLESLESPVGRLRLVVTWQLERYWLHGYTTQAVFQS